MSSTPSPVRVARHFHTTYLGSRYNALPTTAVLQQRTWDASTCGGGGGAGGGHTHIYTRMHTHLPLDHLAEVTYREMRFQVEVCVCVCVASISLSFSPRFVASTQPQNDTQRAGSF